MSAREVLNGIKAQQAATTPGPWVHGGNGYVYDVPEFDLHRFDIMPETIARTELRNEDAEFIAAAPVNVARLTAALEAALALAEQWRYKGEFGWGAWQEGEGPDQEGLALDHAGAELRTAIESALEVTP